MPFFKPNKETKFIIDRNHYQPIYVISYCDISGNLKPLQVSMKLHDESITTYKITTIQSTKEIPHGILFHCLVNNYGQLKEVNVVFFIKEHMWCLQLN